MTKKEYIEFLEAFGKLDVDNDKRLSQIEKEIIKKMIEEMAKQIAEYNK